MEAETLNVFLAPLSVLPLALCRVRDALVKLGYDDVDDFANYDDAALQRLRDNMATECIPPGHADKVVRAINKLREAQQVGPPPDSGAACEASAPQQPPTFNGSAAPTITNDEPLHTAAPGSVSAGSTSQATLQVASASSASSRQRYIKTRWKWAKCKAYYPPRGATSQGGFGEVQAGW